uniref:ATP synthase complex subunit 8 n=1 Tax=Histeroidea sp. 3 KM-2017 TaxID=2219436 RepID=A0A346RIE6_9COLE|nr:ATP synthase F0 subunit 8 [Histeroidea sp. 3 KM-2017]
MPQMSPMSWLLLMIYFILLLILFAMVNYSVCDPMIPDKVPSLELCLNYWKW